MARRAGSHLATTLLDAASSSCVNDCWMQGQGAYGRVYKALRGGVQDVAVKQLVHGGTGQSQKFGEVWFVILPVK